MQIMQIILQLVLFQPCRRFISILEKVLSEEFNSSVGTASPITEIPLQLFDKQRNQWKSNEILQWLLDNIDQTNQQEQRYWLYVILTHILTD